MIHVNKIPVLVTTSWYIHHFTTTAMKEMITEIMMIQRLVSFYQNCNFKIMRIIADEQFQSSRTDLAKL